MESLPCPLVQTRDFKNPKKRFSYVYQTLLLEKHKQRFSNFVGPSFAV